MTLTGLPSEYDKYDALGLAELIAKKQIAPAELLDAVRQRVEAINPKWGQGLEGSGGRL